MRMLTLIVAGLAAMLTVSQQASAASTPTSFCDSTNTGLCFVVQATDTHTVIEEQPGVFAHYWKRFNKYRTDHPYLYGSYVVRGTDPPSVFGVYSEPQWDSIDCSAYGGQNELGQPAPSPTDPAEVTAACFPNYVPPAPRPWVAPFNFETRNAHNLDIYTPAGRPKRAVMLLHGGGWTGGHRSQTAPFAELLATDHQTIAYNVSYGLACDEEGCPHGRELIDDARAALRFAQRDAKRRGVKRVEVMGFSAGGHIATMLAVTGPVAYRPHAAIAFSPPLDLPTHIGGLLERYVDTFIGCSYAACPRKWSVMSPLDLVTRQSRPVYAAFGGAETMVPPRQGFKFRAKMVRHKRSVKLVVVPEAGHSSATFGAWETTLIPAALRWADRQR